MGRSSTAVRRAVVVTGVLLAGSLAACTGDRADDRAEAPTTAEPSATSGSPSQEPEETGTPEPTEDPEIPTELTEPGERLQMDDVALVPVRHFPRGVGRYAVRLESVQKRPYRLAERSGLDLPEGLTDLYYVRQTYELVEPGNAPIRGVNLIEYTAGLVDGVEAVDINADLPGCTFGTFLRDAEVGDRESICMPFLLPPGETLDEVVWYKYDTKYDGLLDGDYVYWSLDG